MSYLLRCIFRKPLLRTCLRPFVFLNQDLPTTIAISNVISGVNFGKNYTGGSNSMWSDVGSNFVAEQMNNEKLKCSNAECGQIVLHRLTLIGIYHSLINNFNAKFIFQNVLYEPETRAQYEDALRSFVTSPLESFRDVSEKFTSHINETPNLDVDKAVKVISHFYFRSRMILDLLALDFKYSLSKEELEVISPYVPDITPEKTAILKVIQELVVSDEY